MVGFDTVLNKGQRAKAQKYQIADLFVENLRNEAQANKCDNWLTGMHRACLFSGLELCAKATLSIVTLN